MIWARMLAYITGTVDQEVLLKNEYLSAENRILRAQMKGRLLLSDAEKATLAEIAHRLGRKALKKVAAATKPDTLMGWYRKLIAKKFDGSKFRKSVGRPPECTIIESSPLPEGSRQRSHDLSTSKLQEFLRLWIPTTVTLVLRYRPRYIWGQAQPGVSDLPLRDHELGRPQGRPILLIE